MSYPIPAVIEIGGPIPRSRAKKLAALITDADLELSSNTPLFTPSTAHDLLHAADGSTLTLHSMDPETHDFPDLEEFLTTHQVAFNRYSASARDFDPEQLLYRTGMREPRVFHSTSPYNNDTGQFLIPETTATEILALLERGHVLESIVALRLAMGLDIAPLTPLRFV